MVSSTDHEIAFSNGRLARRISVGAPTPFENVGLALRTAFGPTRGDDSVGREFARLLDQIR